MEYRWREVRVNLGATAAAGIHESETDVNHFIAIAAYSNGNATILKHYVGWQ